LNLNRFPFFCRFLKNCVFSEHRQRQSREMRPSAAVRRRLGRCRAGETRYSDSTDRPADGAIFALDGNGCFDRENRFIFSKGKCINARNIRSEDGAISL